MERQPTSFSISVLFGESIEAQLIDVSQSSDSRDRISDMSRPSSRFSGSSRQSWF
jgi:hypothetical protein